MKVWITRDGGAPGFYSLWKKKPEYDEFFEEWVQNDGFIISDLCPNSFKQVLKLHKHLPKGKKGIKYGTIYFVEMGEVEKKGKQ